MWLLIGYVLIALVFSFLCSIAEAVILSVTTGYIAVLEKRKKASGAVLRALKQDINRPLAAILTLNTIAHTVGAAGAGAQAAAVFGNAYLGVTSAVLTLLILVFSEIIPKTLGAYYWKQLAPLTAYFLKALVWFLYPFVWFSGFLTRRLTHGPTLTGFSRNEFKAMADIGAQEGRLARQESTILKNLLALNEMSVRDAMTPRTVVFSVPETLDVGTFFDRYGDRRFSRIPVYGEEQEQVTGFVLRSDLLLARARGEVHENIRRYRRDLPAVPGSMPLSRAFEELLQRRAHILLVVDEYGGVAGVLTLEDVLETLLGLEIVDESDQITNMQELARRLWKRRKREMGLNSREDEF